MVIQHLASAGANFFRLNTEEFPQRVQLKIELGDGNICGFLKYQEKIVDLRSISCIWNRRPHKPEIDPRVTDEAIRTWAQEEAAQALEILWSLLTDRIWMNPPDINKKLDFNKWLQMVAASEVGFVTPSSLLTNIPAAALQFWEANCKEAAYKAIKHEVIRYHAKRPAMITTKRLTHTDMTDANLARIAITPVFLQRYIHKEKELRITVVGDRVFTCEINSQQSPQTAEDWRAHIFGGNSPPLKIFELPHNIETKCLLLISRLNLLFGCIDMIVTPEDEYVFLEVNPNGQWAWVEQQTGLPISREIANWLIDRENS